MEPCSKARASSLEPCSKAMLEQGFKLGAMQQGMQGFSSLEQGFPKVQGCHAARRASLEQGFPKDMHLLARDKTSIIIAMEPAGHGFSIVRKNMEYDIVFYA